MSSTPIGIDILKRATIVKSFTITVQKLPHSTATSNSGFVLLKPLNVVWGTQNETSDKT